jgi:membrane fusion protein (multidrug efflux system)
MMIKRILASRLKSIHKSLSLPLKTKRQKMFIYLFASILLFSCSSFAYWFFYSSHYISTHNAYVGAEVAEVTSLIEGLVEHIYVADTQQVKVGDILVGIDEQDIKLALKQVEAKFLRAQADLERTELNYKRRKSLAAANLVSAEELSDTENALKVAEAVFQETSALKELAELNHTRTKIYAPIEGVVAQRHVQMGQRVRPGNKLLSIVPLSNSYVSANFKENECRNIKPGQPVTLTSDKYGSGVKFHGQVEGLSGGTGAVFALIPAQNATGNWIKVVQRLPVRITLNPEELIKHPLEVGLSMHTRIDISEKE